MIRRERTVRLGTKSARAGAFRTDTIAIVGLSVGWLALVALVNPVGDFPLNDDWSYGGAAQLLAQTGELRIPGWTTATVVSQVVWGALFCLPTTCSYTALRFSTLTLGLIGLYALYGLLRELGADSGTAFLGSATLAVNPLYFVLANSFMTDVPFVSFSIVSAALLVRGLQRRSFLALALGIVAAFIALLDRQVALALLLGLAAACLARDGFKPSSIMKALLPLGVGLVVYLGYQRWLIATGRVPHVPWSGFSGIIPDSLPLFMQRSTRYCLLAAPYVGLFVLPFLVAIPATPGLAPLRAKAIRALSAIVAVVIFAILWWRDDMMPSLPNVIIQSGFGPLTQADTFHLDLNLPPVSAGVDGFWIVATALGCAGIYAMLSRILFALFAWRDGPRSPENRAPVALFLGTTLAAYWFAIWAVAGNNQRYDRYLLFLVPLLIAGFVLLLRNGTGHRSPSAVLRSVFLLAAFTAFAVAGTHDYLAWNRTRWQALTELTQADHVPPEKIDGGYEFNGRFLYDPNYRPRPGKSEWWVHDDEFMLASGDLPGYRTLREYRYVRWLPFPGLVVILQRLPGA
jgi:hypothetical protein